MLTKLNLKCQLKMIILLTKSAAEQHDSSQNPPSTNKCYVDC